METLLGPHEVTEKQWVGYWIRDRPLKSSAAAAVCLHPLP